jgi:hypothetical protein
MQNYSGFITLIPFDLDFSRMTFAFFQKYKTEKNRVPKTSPTRQN